MNSKIKIWEWIFLIIATIILDIIQVILEFFVIGVILNRIIDVVVGVLLPFYFWLRGTSMTNWKNLLSMFGGFAVEEVGLGGDDGLPFWTLEVILVWLTTVAEKRIAKQVAKHPALGKLMNVMNKINQATSNPMPLNKDGVRLPQQRTPPLNQNGFRSPLPKISASSPQSMNIDGIRAPNVSGNN